MRTVDDICLLCRINKSERTDSHILPRFISTNFLGAEGTQRRGHELSSDKEDVNKSRVIQDSPKEKYILCDDCENYFSVLERLAAPTFRDWREKVETGEFYEGQIHEDVSIVVCTSANPKVLRLLVYSMFWRASISSLRLFENYHLAPEMEESLRMALMVAHSPKEREFKEKLGEARMVIHPYAALTARTFKDETANVVAAINAGNPASLHVDRFGFLLFKDPADIANPVFSQTSNANEQDRMIMVFSQRLWQELMVEKTAAVYKKSVEARKNKPAQ